MRVGVGRSLPLVLAVAACTETVAIDLPIEDGQSAVLVIRSPATDDGVRPVQLYGIDVGQRPENLATREGTDLFLLTYDGPLGTRAIPSGVIDLELEPNKGRPVPVAADIFKVTSPGAVWASQEEPPKFLETIKLEELETCDFEDACIRFYQDRPICELPCPTLSPVEPPPAPNPPQLVAPVCPAGLSLDGDFCAAPAQQSCADGLAQLLGEASCGALVECGSAFRMPANPIGTVVYVDENGAPNASGSENDPFRSIRDALDTPGPLTMLIAPGVYPVVTTFDRDTMLVGACPEDTMLQSFSVSAGADVTIDGLRVDGRIINGGTVIVEQGVIDEIEVAGRLDGRRSRFGTIETPATTGSPEIHLDDVTIATLGAAASATVTVRRSAIKGTGITAVGAVGGAYITLTDSYVDARYAFRAGGQSTFDVRRVYVDVGEGFGSVLEDARFDAAMLGVRGSQDAASFRDGSTTTFDAAFWSGTASPAFDVRGEASLDVGRLLIRGVGLAIEAEGESTVSLHDFDASGFSRLVQMIGEGEVTLARGRSDSGVLIGPVGPTDELSPILSGRIIDDCSVNGLPLDASRIDVDIDDVAFDARGRSGLVLCPGTTVDLERVSIENALIGVLADCRRTCAEPQEVVTMMTNGLTVTGGAQSQIGLLHRGGQLTMNRARFTDIELYGVYSWGNEMDIADLSVSAIGAGAPIDPMDLDVYCSENRGGGNLRGASSALFTEAWSGTYALEDSEVRLRRFRLTDAACAGISMGVDGNFLASDGAITDNYRGLNFLRFAEPTVGADVVFKDNRQADVYSVAAQD